MTQKNLLVACRGGIGDHIISNGALHYLTSEEKGNRLAYLVCYSDWFDSLTYYHA